MNNWIIQIAAPAAKAADMDMSLWGLVVKGGWLMIPIFILSIIAIYIACERFWILRKTGTGDEAFMQLYPYSKSRLSYFQNIGRREILFPLWSSIFMWRTGAI